MTTLHSDVDNGWAFGSSGDPMNGMNYIYEFYHAADSGYSGRATIPVLWDTKTSTIVNNESADIIVMLNSAFDEWADTSIDLYPQALAAQIDSVNESVYQGLNNTVYRAGFSTDQATYEEAVTTVFQTIEVLEQRRRMPVYTASAVKGNRGSSFGPCNSMNSPFRCPRPCGWPLREPPGVRKFSTRQ
jgi:putative glutathione S-transferase